MCVAMIAFVSNDTQVKLASEQIPLGEVMFLRGIVTMVLAAVDPRDHVLEFANAGHAPAIHFCARTRQITALESTGFPLGVTDEPNYARSKPVALGVRDLIVLCTD